MAQANPFEHLDLIEYACQELMVSFAVSNRAGISNFSMAISMIINKGKLNIIIGNDVLGYHNGFNTTVVDHLNFAIKLS